MHHSKSSSLLQPGVTTKHSELTNSQRARRRSSLDTFVIPGRTRIPSSRHSKSSETDVTDFLVTQGLLRHSMMQLPNKQPPSIQELQYQGRGSWSHVEAAKSSSRSGKKNSTRIQKRPSRVRAELVMQPPPRYGSRDLLQVPPQRPRIEEFQPATHQLVTITSQDHPGLQSFDGANEPLDSGHTDSRMTSMTWSTVSHRIFTDSSGSSRRSGASHYLVEYNHLAEKHGLRRMPEASSDDGSETKTTTKTHHGWLARKIFRRTSSTYTLRAKTTYKPLTRKKSLAGIPLLSSNAPKNILTGKSLEMLSRLGGLGILLLPHEFAVDKLTLPTSLSAIATYLLQHGCNAPGLFRVSGQTTTINALYEFYDHQFSDAGSPSKVETTVGSGLLPTHIEHTLPDVASLFKKILIGLPGGLLGSLELFEALKDILLKLQRDPEQAVSDYVTLKAKLVALAISCVTSSYRIYLIEAVLGLCAYFAFETEKFHAEQAAGENDERPSSSKSELMGYQSLGVVLGPLLLGDLTDNVDLVGGVDTLDGAPRKSSESAKRSKKQKRNSVPSKLEKDATLTAHVDRANLTASVMQQLLVIWRDVVRQLKGLNGMYSSSLMQSRSTSQIKKIPTRTTSRLTLRTSEEEMQFMDLLRGRPLPEQFRNGAHMKRTVRISSRSPMSPGAIKVSDDGQINGSGLPDASYQQGNEEAHDVHVDEPAEQDADRTVDLEASSSTRIDDTNTEDINGLSVIRRTHSDIAMDQMAMGTILPQLQDTSDSPASQGCVRLVSSMDDHSEDEHHEDLESSTEVPQTVVKISRTPNYDDEPRTQRQRSSLDKDKPLPPIGKAQRAELSSPLTGKELAQAEARGLLSSRRSSRRSMSMLSSRHPSPRTLFPARHGRHGSIEGRSRQQSGSREGQFYFPLRQDSLPARLDAPLSPTKNASRKWSEGYIGGDQMFGDPRRNSVRILAEQFADKSRAQRKEAVAERRNELPKVYAYVHALPSSNDQEVEDPFVCPTDVVTPDKPHDERTPSPEKESMIPKPQFDIGRGRKAESRSPSPPKRAAPKSPGKRPSVYSVIPDQDAEILRRNTNELSESAAKAQREAIVRRMQAIATNGLGLPEEDSPVQHLEPSPIHQSTASSESLYFSPAAEEQEILLAQPMHNRILSSARPASPHARSDSTSRNVQRPLSHLDMPSTHTNNFLNASNELKKLVRHGSINATLYTEILRLQRQLELKGDEVQTARRGLDAVRVVDERKSAPKERPDDEVKRAKKEVDIWRVRAERAERRLAEKSAKKSKTKSQDQDQATSPKMVKCSPGLVRCSTPLTDQRFDVRKMGSPRRGVSRTTSSRDLGSGAQSPVKMQPRILPTPSKDHGMESGTPAKTRTRIPCAASRDQNMDIGSEKKTKNGGEIESVAVKKHGAEVDIMMWEDESGQSEGADGSGEHRCGSRCDH